MQTIYLDVLLLTNLYVNYFLLRGAARLTGSHASVKRILLASLLGSLASCVIFLPQSWSLPLAVAKPFLAAVLVRVAFGKCRLRLLLFRTGVFFLVNLLFAGVMILFWTVFRPQILYIAHGVVYLDISAVLLAVGTVAAYGVLMLWERVHKSKGTLPAVCRLTVILGDKRCQTTALPDTGNQLWDAFTDLPVLICEWEAVKPLLPKETCPFFIGEADSLPPDNPFAVRVRCIPYHGIGGDGLLRAFRADSVQVNGQSARPALIAVVDRPLSDGSYHAILHHSLLQQKEEAVCYDT